MRVCIGTWITSIAVNLVFLSHENEHVYYTYNPDTLGLTPSWNVSTTVQSGVPFWTTLAYASAVLLTTFPVYVALMITVSFFKGEFMVYSASGCSAEHRANLIIIITVKYRIVARTIIVSTTPLGCATI